MWHATSIQANPQPLSPAGLNAQRVSGTLDTCCSAVVLTKSSQSSLCAGVDAVTVLSPWTLLPLKPGNLRALEREQAIQQEPTAQKERYVKRVNLKLCRHTYDVKNANKYISPKMQLSVGLCNNAVIQQRIFILNVSPVDKNTQLFMFEQNCSIHSLTVVGFSLNCKGANLFLPITNCKKTAWTYLCSFEKNVFQIAEQSSIIGSSNSLHLHRSKVKHTMSI